MWAVVPIKLLNAAKQRLAHALEQPDRRRLMLAMAEDVLAALAGVSSLGGVAVVSGDPEVVALARRFGFRHVPEPEACGHTAAVAHAATLLAGEGALGMLTLPGDVPLVTAAEIGVVLAAHGGARSVTLVPAHDRRGTNCAVCSPPTVIPLRFGKASFSPHVAAARACGVAPRVLALPGLGLDIDTPDDLEMLLNCPAPTRTHAVLAASGIAARFSAAGRSTAAARAPA